MLPLPRRKAPDRSADADPTAGHDLRAPLLRFIGAIGSPAASVSRRLSPSSHTTTSDFRAASGRGVLDDRAAVGVSHVVGPDRHADARRVREILRLPVAARPPPEAKERVVDAAGGEELGRWRRFP